MNPIGGKFPFGPDADWYLFSRTQNVDACNIQMLSEDLPSSSGQPSVRSQVQVLASGIL
jgi:hypothetical protein